MKIKNLEIIVEDRVLFHGIAWLPHRAYLCLPCLQSSLLHAFCLCQYLFVFLQRHIAKRNPLFFLPSPQIFALISKLLAQAELSAVERS